MGRQLHAHINPFKHTRTLQHGRHKALASAGASVGEYQARGTLMALSELNIKYRQPLRSGDAFRVETSVEQVCVCVCVCRETGGDLASLQQKHLLCSSNFKLDSAPSHAQTQVTAARLVLRQRAVRCARGGGGEALCAEGHATVVFIDADYKPMRLPPADRAMFQALQQAAAAAAAAGDGSSSKGGGV